MAQTDAGPLLRPWPKGQQVQVEGDILFLNQGHVKRSDEDFQLSVYESAGRWRLDDSRELNPTVGYDFTLLDLDTQSPLLPDKLLDQSVGFGSPFAESGPWFFAAAAGIGYAGDEPFGDANAWYGKATLIAGRQFGEESSLIFGLDYNGNRSIYPDIPLPGFVYTRRIDPTLLAVIGFPYSSIVWEPAERLKIELIYSVPETIDARIEYEMSSQWRLFANFENRVEAFHLDDTDGNDRLFFQQRRLEMGLRWEPDEAIGLIFAGGYAFGQKFTTGFDLRDDDRLVKVSDEAYLRFALEVRQ